MSEVKKSKKKALIAASMAGLLAVSGVALTLSPAHAAGDKCYGVNKCKGQGECGAKGHSCAGKNECSAKGWVTTQDADTCVKQGGTLQAAAE